MRDYLNLAQEEKLSVMDMIEDILYIVDDWCDARALESDLFINEEILERDFKNQFRVDDLNEVTEMFEKSLFWIPTSSNFVYMYQSGSYDLILRLEELGSKNLGVFIDFRYIKGDHVDNVRSFLYESHWTSWRKK